MRRAWAVLALLLLALPADAARYVGTWFVGDNVRVLRLVVRDANGTGWGTAVGKGYTPYLYVTYANDDTILIQATGTWEDTTETAALFSPGMFSSIAPTSGRQDFDCLLYMVSANKKAVVAADDAAEPFRFRLQRHP
jgi:hypothetical protein